MSYGYDYEPKNHGIYLTLKNKGDKALVRLVTIPMHFTDEYAGKTFESFAWKVIDRESGEIKAFKGNVTIYKKIKALARSEEWGDPMTYDLKITRTEGDGDDYWKVEPVGEITEITEIEEELIANTECDLKKLFKISEDKGTSTFGGGDNKETDEGDINLDDIPF